MRVLLDTNALLLAVVSPGLMVESAREIVFAQATKRFVSSASVWEIATKTRFGKLDGGRLVDEWPKALAALRAESLVVDDADALRAGGLKWEHRDPFDRMIVAQARRHEMVVATSDRRIIATGFVESICILRRR